MFSAHQVPISINGSKARPRKQWLNTASILNGIIMGRHFISCNDWKIRHAIISYHLLRKRCKASLQCTRLKSLQLSEQLFSLVNILRLKMFYSLYNFSLVTHCGVTSNNVRRDMKWWKEKKSIQSKGIHHTEQFQCLTQMQEMIDKFHHGRDHLV